MRLSEAIRLGSMMTSQAYGAFRYRDEEGNESTCALGAAMVATNNRIQFEILMKVVPYPKGVFAAPEKMAHVISTLNDFYKWPREKIADWVESIENGYSEYLEPEQERHRPFMSWLIQ